MNSRYLFTLLLIFLGQVLLILCFYYFGENVERDVLVLNAVVSSVIYCSLFIQALFPWVDFKNRSFPKIGSLGVRWFFSFFYILAAVTLMVGFNSFYHIDFRTQLLIHSILFFLFLIGLLWAFTSYEKVSEVYLSEKSNAEGVSHMRKVISQLILKLETRNNVAPEIKETIRKIEDNLRYLSPSNSSDAKLIEQQFILQIQELDNYLDSIEPDAEKCRLLLHKCEQTVFLRKNSYSS